MNPTYKIFTLIFSSLQLVTLGYSARQQIGQFYFINWDLDVPNSRITCELEAQTTGFVGFGLARTPEVSLMNEADIVIGGVNSDGTEYFADRHGVNNTIPVIDEQQDYTFISASQNGTHTLVKFSRAFQTNDSDDVELILGNQTILWSFGETDELAYHGGINRGSFRINWLSL